MCIIVAFKFKSTYISNAVLIYYVFNRKHKWVVGTINILRQYPSITWIRLKSYALNDLLGTGEILQGSKPHSCPARPRVVDRGALSISGGGMSGYKTEILTIDRP
jgi:hypothetical protein